MSLGRDHRGCDQACGRRDQKPECLSGWVPSQIAPVDVGGEALDHLLHVLEIGVDREGAAECLQGEIGLLSFAISI